MSCKGALEQGEGLRTRSFRNEDYSSRRIFLRSYPLQWGPDDDEYEADEDDLKQQNESRPGYHHFGDQKESAKAKMKTKKKKGENNNKYKKKIVLKKIVISVLEWGEGKVLVYRRFKNKVTFYVISCFPVGLKAPTALISA